MKLQTDYLVVGAGATGMAFVDTLLAETDADVIMLDRRHAAGGHWNDAYPFVRLHQPSQSYGVASKPLGSDRIDQTGTNKGYYELASGAELTHYYHALMDEFLASGRVKFFPLTEYVGDNTFRSVVSGDIHEVDVSKKRVNAAQFQTQIPMTHTRKFEVGSGVVCVPPNDLPRHIADHDHVTVLGAGKTAMDTIVWLQELGFPPERITWVISRDVWMWNRKFTQPGIEFFEQSIGGTATSYEIYATSASTREIAERMEEAGIWMRLDQSVFPNVFHAPTVSETEVALMRQVKDIIRLGRVTAIQQDRIHLAKGDVAATPGSLFVDCTASAGEKNVGDHTPVFRPGEINLQMVRQIQPCFSAAIIAFIEANVEDEAEKAKLAQPTPMFDTVDDLTGVLATAMMNQFHWSQNPAIRSWMSGCRLNGAASVVSQIRPDDAERQAVLVQVMKFAGPAVENLMKLSQASR